jgi:hypothetical protein
MIYEHACRNGTEAADRLVASSLDRRRTLREPPLAISAESEANSPAQGVRASTLKGWQRPALRAPFTQRRPLWLRLRRPGLLPQHGASSTNRPAMVCREEFRCPCRWSLGNPRRRGVSALKDAANIERLWRCDAAARTEINERIASLIAAKSIAA